MTLAVVGSRSYTNYDQLRSELRLLKTGDFDFNALISGGALGADKMAETFAKDHKLPITVLKPDWKKYGKKAGLLRNIGIIKAADYVIAFWDMESAGTRHAITVARRLGKPVKVIKINSTV